MPKPPLREPFRTLELELIESMEAGLHEWRPDLAYPESYSDMQAAVRGVLKMFEIKRRPIGITDVAICEPRKTCAFCGEVPSFSFTANGVTFCGNSHARAWAERLLQHTPPVEVA